MGENHTYGCGGVVNCVDEIFYKNGFAKSEGVLVCRGIELFGPVLDSGEGLLWVFSINWWGVQLKLKELKCCRRGQNAKRGHLWWKHRVYLSLKPYFACSCFWGIVWGDMQKILHSAHGQAICEAIKSVRKRAGLTQRELCRKLDRVHSFISKCEMGERRVDIAEFYWRCRACELSRQKEIQSLVNAISAV